MPSPFAATLIAFGAVLTAVSGLAGAIVAGVGVLVEVFVTASTPVAVPPTSTDEP